MDSISITKGKLLQMVGDAYDDLKDRAGDERPMVVVLALSTSEEYFVGVRGAHHLADDEQDKLRQAIVDTMEKAVDVTITAPLSWV